MYKLLSDPAVVVVTTQLAEQFRDMPACPGDRTLSAARLDELRIAAENQELRVVDWATCYCEQTKKTYRVNGKHTSTLLADMNGHAGRCLAVISQYETERLGGVARLYGTFDSRISARTPSELNNSYASSDHALAKAVQPSSTKRRPAWDTGCGICRP